MRQLRTSPDVPSQALSLPEWIQETLRDRKPLLTVPETADLLRSSERNVRRKIAQGELHAVRGVEGAGSSRVLIPCSSLAAYLRRLDSGGRAA